MEEKLKILKSCNEELDNNNTTEEINKLLLIELEKMKKYQLLSIAVQVLEEVELLFVCIIYIMKL